MTQRPPPTLFELSMAFMDYVERKGQPSFPPLNSRLWHDLFYAVKLSFGHKFPTLKEMGPFTANGGYAKNKDLTKCLEEIARVSTSRFDTGRIFIHIGPKESDLRSNCSGLIEEMYATAARIAGFFENK